ncbi:PKD domain-containing protein [uncultured Nitrospira sp.]|uniref:PKD domain-containing protein n=1 Tax=uncultured Nitrospira sp. TaxID=157176 RepID=UPI0031407658
MTWSWKTYFRIPASSTWIVILFLIFLNVPGKAKAAQDFVVLGNEGVWIRQGSTILSGDVGANQTSIGPYLNGEQEMTIGHDVVVQNSNSQIIGDTVRLKSGSQIQNIVVNTLLGPGQILGTRTTPVRFPLVSELPPVPSVHPGSQDLDVPAGGVLTLQAGRYGRLKVRPGAIVTLSGGLYHFQEWDIREEAQVLATKAVEIRVAGQIDTRRHTVVGPAPGAVTLTAADVLIISTGINGRTGSIDDTPEAVKFGEGSKVRAKVYAPKGLLRVKAESRATGAFVGKWVRMGNHTTIALEGGFGLGQGGNTPAVAHAGPDQTVRIGMTVQLDGTDSTDVDGNLLTYRWTILSQPVGNTAALSDTTAIMPTLAINTPGIYTLQLIVNDGSVDSDPDTVTITTINSPPVAGAGQDQTVFVTQSVLLNGNGSHDVDGDPLSFNWSFVSIPNGSRATLSNPTSSMSDFLVDLAGTYQVQLIVNDGQEVSTPDMVLINTQNSKPVAHAGQDQTVPVGSTVNLNGSGSHDVDGNSLTFQWSLIAKPTGSTATLSHSTSIQPTFGADLVGLYVAQLIVNDGMENSDPITVIITTGNTPPVADAGQDQNVPVFSLVTLNGSGSHDVDGDALSFQWSLESRPQGSTATLLNPTFAQPTFIPNIPGTYVVRVVVSDEKASSSPDTVVIVAHAPLPLQLPALLITSPSEGSLVGMSPITVTGFVNDPNASVTVNGVSATVTGGVFLADGIVLHEGGNSLIVRGVDGAGHTNSVNLGVTLSATPTNLTPIWGPVAWVKHATGEEIFKANFSNCEPAAHYQLVMINGTSGGANRVTHGTVLLNGTEVIGAQNFTGAHSQITEPIVVQARNNLEVRLTGPLGAQVQAYIACTANCLTVTIDAPLANATINQPTMLVKGKVMSSGSSLVGVVVNQQAAKVLGSAYAIERVPLREGTGTLGPTTVVAQATNACGQQASSTIQVHTTEILTNQVQLRVSPDRNVAPSQVTLRVSIEIDQPVANIQWDFQGDGTIDLQGPDLFEHILTFTQPGLYLPKVRVTDTMGNIFEATAVVQALDPVAFEIMLNAEWSGMMEALAQGDIEQALSHILIRKREVMRHDWTVLKDHLGELANVFNVPLQLTDGRGRRVVGKSSTPLILGEIQYPLEVEFVLDTDGQWRIRSF